MWSKFLEVKSGYTAQLWREFFWAEGVAIQIVPPLESDNKYLISSSSSR